MATAHFDPFEQILSDAHAISETISADTLNRSVPSCPDWDLRQLVTHLGFVHRWAQQCVVSTESPHLGGIKEPANNAEAPELATWLTEGAGLLVETLKALGPEAPAWNPFPAEKTVRDWTRRQLHETAVHRWDAQLATGVPSEIGAELASDGIDEFFELGVHRAIQRSQIDLPPGSVHVHCTDVSGEWLFWADDGAFRLVREHRKGDAALRGPAQQLLLTLRGRNTERDGIDTVGDQAVVNSWLDLPGW